MTKKDLIKWLEEQRSRAVTEVADKKDKALEDCRKKIIDEIELDKTAGEIQAKFNEIDEMITTWKSKLDPDMVVPKQYWNSTARDLNKYIYSPDATKQVLLSHDLIITSSKAYRKIQKKFDEMQNNVNREYRNVIANVQALKNAKLGVEYLESLGFDLTKLKEADNKPLTTAISVPINTEYLFIGGDEK